MSLKTISRGSLPAFKVFIVFFFISVTLVFPNAKFLDSKCKFPILYFVLNFPGKGITLPFTINFITLFSAFEVTVIDLLNLPGLFSDLYKTLTKPFSSGSIEPVDQLGVVHPQEAFTFVIFKGSSPVLEKIKSCS